MRPRPVIENVSSTTKSKRAVLIAPTHVLRRFHAAGARVVDGRNHETSVEYPVPPNRPADEATATGRAEAVYDRREALDEGLWLA